MSCQENLYPAGLAGLDEGRHIHHSGFQRRLRDGVSEPLVEGSQIAALLGPIGVTRLLGGSGQHLHAFLVHEGVVGASNLPMNPVIPWRLTRHRVVVQDSDVGVDAAALAVVVNYDHCRTVGPHLLGQQESEISGSPQIGGIIHIQFVRVERKHVRMGLHLPAVLLRQPVAEFDEPADVRRIAVEPRSQPVSAGGFVIFPFRSDAELQIVRSDAQVVDRRNRCNAHGCPLPPSASTMRSCCCVSSSITVVSRPRSTTP